MSDAKIGLQAGENNPFFGIRKNHSDETKQKMSEVRKGILLGRPRPVGAGCPGVQIEVLDLSTGIKTVYPSIHEAARALDIPQRRFLCIFLRIPRSPIRGDINSPKFNRSIICL
jgi:hypothetical protein